MKQYDLEKEMNELGIHRHQQKVLRTKEKGIESQNPIGRRLLTESVASLALEIDDWKHQVKSRPAGQRHAAFEYIDILDSPLVAAIAARAIIDSISIHRKITKTAIHVASLLEDEARWRKMKADHPSIWKHNEKQVRRIAGYSTKKRYLRNSEKFVDLQFSKWPLAIKVKVGMVLIEKMRMATGIIDVTTRTGLLGKRETYVHPTEELVKWMKEAYKYSEALAPIYLPMVEKPKEWDGIYSGGYLSDQVPQHPLVRSQDRGHLDDLDSIGITEPINAVNNLQNVPYKINSTICEVLEYCWENDIQVGVLPPADGEALPPKPSDISENKESRRKWRKAAARIRFENEANTSKRLMVTKVLWLANKFLNEKIFFPWYMDFRSRMYPKPYYLNPQGPEFVKALLSFYNGVPIETKEDEDSLAIHGANCWGEDKSRLDARVAWVADNEDMIIEIAENPKGTTNLWGKADKPWLFLAFCLEWSAYRWEGFGFVSHLPCAIDGSVNGLQLYSLAMLDPIGAKATNVTPSDEPEDLYFDVADYTIELLKKSDKTMAKTWLEFGFGRDATKRPCMTVPYSATKYSCIQYTIDWFYEDLKKKGCDNPFGWEEIYEPCSFLADFIWEAISGVVGEARKAMEWIQECSDICVENDVPLRWFNPSGFLVKQAYETWQTQSIRTVIGDTVRQHRVRVGTGELSRRKARNASPPNWVHSLDAAVAHLGINGCVDVGILDINEVHDCFETHASNVVAMRDILLQTLVDMFSENLLENFRYDLTQHLPSDIQLPSPPPRGDLALETVLKSLYCFS